MAGLFSHIRNLLKGGPRKADMTGGNDLPLPGISDFPLPWIEAADNPYGKRLLDLRALTQSLLSAQVNTQMAENALSFVDEDGTSFIRQTPADAVVIDAQLSYLLDARLQPGVLFTPRRMEHKWAIFFHDDTIRFVRSGMRRLQASARTIQKNNNLIIRDITGTFSDDSSAEFTRSSLHYLLLSHALRQLTPVPLPPVLADSPRLAALWAFFTYGAMAEIGIFEESFRPTVDIPLRSFSLLHAAVAKGGRADIRKQIENGLAIDCRDANGLSALHWSLTHDDVAVLDTLLTLGADPDCVSDEGATPLMNAAQSNRIEHMKMLIKAGGNINAKDKRGFTALHRAAEIGFEPIVATLLDNGADRTTTAQGYTPAALAELRHHENILALLRL